MRRPALGAARGRHRRSLRPADGGAPLDAYEDRPIAPELVDTVCEQALAGSSSSGNLNMVSVVRTRDLERKRRVYELYFEQPMVEQAPPVMTFCADTFRTVPDFSPHGTRGTAATLLREHGFSRDVVELMLAHAERNKVTAAYHHHDMAEERRRALRYLADQIDRIAGATPPAASVDASIESRRSTATA